jgi:hypothetical protein
MCIRLVNEYYLETIKCYYTGIASGFMPPCDLLTWSLLRSTTLSL